MRKLVNKEMVQVGAKVFVRNHGFHETGHEAVIEKVNAKSVVVEGRRFNAKNNGRYYRCEATDQILHTI